MKVFGLYVKPINNTLKAFGKENYQGVMFQISLGKDKGFATVMWAVNRDPNKLSSKFPTINMIDTNKKYYIPIATIKLNSYVKQDGSKGINLVFITDYIDYLNPIDFKNVEFGIKTTGLNEFDNIEEKEEEPIDTTDFFEKQENDDNFDF